MGEIPQECRFCNALVTEDFRGRETYRCRHGRFDVVDRFTPGRMIPRWFAWSGIWRPNKTVASAQKDCHRFLVHPLVVLISKKGPAASV